MNVTRIVCALLDTGSETSAGSKMQFQAAIAVYGHGFALVVAAYAVGVGTVSHKISCP